MMNLISANLQIKTKFFFSGNLPNTNHIFFQYDDFMAEKACKKLAVFIEKLKRGLSFSCDPFADDYFNLVEYLAKKEAEEKALSVEITAALKEQQLKREFYGQCDAD